MPGELSSRDEQAMRHYWDQRARENAAWFVDTTLAYDDPDMVTFLATGERIVATALGDAPVPPAMHRTALEIGSGLGRNCLALSRHFDRVMGLDISQEMVDRARELVPVENVDFRINSGSGLEDVEDASVDFVLTFTVLQHIVDEGIVLRYLREAARVLRPGGVLAAQWNNQPPVRFRLQMLRRRLVSALLKEPSDHHRLERPFVGTAVRESMVRRTLVDAGLQVDRMVGTGTLYAWLWARKPLESAGADTSG